MRRCHTRYWLSCLAVLLCLLPPSFSFADPVSSIQGIAGKDSNLTWRHLLATRYGSSTLALSTNFYGLSIPVVGIYMDRDGDGTDFVIWTNQLPSSDLINPGPSGSPTCTTLSTNCGPITRSILYALAPADGTCGGNIGCITRATITRQNNNVHTAATSHNPLDVMLYGANFNSWRFGIASQMWNAGSGLTAQDKAFVIPGMFDSTAVADFPWQTSRSVGAGANGTQFHPVSLMGLNTSSGVWQRGEAGTNGAIHVKNFPTQRFHNYNQVLTSAPNTAVTLTMTASTNDRNAIYRIDASCSAGTATITIADGATTIWNTLTGEVGTARFRSSWNPGLTGSINTAMTVTLSACGVGNVGTLITQGDVPS